MNRESWLLSKKRFRKPAIRKFPITNYVMPYVTLHMQNKNAALYQPAPISSLSLKSTRLQLLEMGHSSETVVLYPGIGAGHLTPITELAKVLVPHGFSVVIATLDTADKIASTAAFAAKITAAHPSISIRRVLPLDFPAPAAPFELTNLANPYLLEHLRSIPNLRALIMDFFNTNAIDVARELGIPCYVFFASGATNLAVFLNIPTLGFESTARFRDLGDSIIDFPGVYPQIPASKLPKHFRDTNEAGYNMLLYHFRRFPAADGIVVNTFRSLEEPALEAIAAGRCVEPAPQVYSVGPLTAEPEKAGSDRHPALAWLDAQPPRSVVFLSFGSMGSFPADQLKEIATGLEQSGERFLWVVRSPPADPTKWFAPRPEPDFDLLLPVGFLDRTAERGLVVKSWAPQVAVLGHVAVGGFVTHCGWNSVLEAIVAGVPMIAWPLYAEQGLNKLFLVERGLAAELKGCGDGGLVAAEEVEERVKWLMQSEGGRGLRERAEAVRESSAAALAEGGSSRVELVDFVAAIKSSGSN